MNKLLYLLFLSIFLFDFLSFRFGVLGHAMTWFPEFLSMLTLLIIPARFILGGGKDIPPKCTFFLTLFILNIIIGVIANNVSPGTVVAGLRSYIKFIPFFILPFVYRFSDEQISEQLKLLFFLFIIQAPLSLYQRLVETHAKGIVSGDAVTGTLNNSGHLTVLLTFAIAILMSFYLSKRITLTSFLGMFLVLFMPMTINETKSTIILLPIAVLLPLFLSEGGVKLKQFVPVLIIGTLAGIAFIFVYDYFVAPRWGYGILDFFTMEGRIEKYLSGTEPRSENDSGPVGKVESFTLAFQKLSESVLSLLFGLGIGNVSESFIPSLSGAYAEKYSGYCVKTTSLSLILWELGLLGALLYYSFFFMVFKDSRRLSRSGGLVGIVAKGWSVVAVLMALSVAYTNVIQENVASYLFWYFSGYIMSENFRYKRVAVTPVNENFSFEKSPLL